MCRILFDVLTRSNRKPPLCIRRPKPEVMATRAQVYIELFVLLRKL